MSSQDAFDAAFIDRAYDILWEVEAGYPKSACRHARSAEGSDLWDETVREVAERRAAGLPDQTRSGPQPGDEDRERIGAAQER